ncbi:MAG: efflux RND transporter periplasmic adaptor subunit [Bacteroidetes bacterium]|nr:efflux RND transporter periplasmic adaptor subunit [Bacteroidota bacterium]
MNADKADLNELRIDRSAGAYETSSGRGPSKIWIFGGIALVLIIAAFLLYPAFVPAKRVTLTTVNLTFPSQVSGILTASGYIVPQRKAAVASKGTGRLVYLSVEEGDVVKKDQVIARLEDNDVRAQLDQVNANLIVAQAQAKEAEADLEKAKKEYERSELLWKSQVLTDSEFEIVRAQYQSSEARVNSAKANIVSLEAAVRGAEVAMENTVIRAPFDGTVLTKNADVGEIVAPFAAGANSRGNVVTVADMGSLQLEADVSESNIERVKINQPCEIILDAFPERRYRGEVWKIVPTADRAKATILTKIKFIDIDNKVLPEMSAKVTFLREAMSDSAAQAKPKMLIQQSALVQRNGTHIVFIAKNNSVLEKAVVLGEKTGDQVEVLGGLSVGDRIVSSPPPDLKDGDKIETANS